MNMLNQLNVDHPEAGVQHVLDLLNACVNDTNTLVNDVTNYHWWYKKPTHGVRRAVDIHDRLSSLEKGLTLIVILHNANAVDHIGVVLNGQDEALEHIQNRLLELQVNIADIATQMQVLGQLEDAQLHMQEIWMRETIQAERHWLIGITGGVGVMAIAMARFGFFSQPTQPLLKEEEIISVPEYMRLLQGK